MAPPDPERDGLMPAILSAYERLAPRMARAGFPPRVGAARGPLAIAAHLLGVTEFLVASQTDRGDVGRLLDLTTELCIAWLAAQLARMDSPLGILVLDDLVGMLGPDDAEEFACPRLRRVFGTFSGLVRFFHNDTPNPAVYEGLGGCGIDAFNLSHKADLADAGRRLGPGVVLMGNLPPLDLLARGTPAECRAAAEALLARVAEVGPIVISAGGGVSPGTPVENLQAVVAAVRASGGVA